jgi:hypothetical protein
MNLLVNIEEIRARARKQIEDGAVTQDYGLDRERVIQKIQPTVKVAGSH